MGPLQRRENRQKSTLIVDYFTLYSTVHYTIIAHFHKPEKLTLIPKMPRKMPFYRITFDTSGRRRCSIYKIVNLSSQ